MKGLLILGLLFCLLAAAAGQDFSWDAAQIPGSFVPNPDEDYAYWGLSFYMNVTPDATFLFPLHADDTENGNNTDYIYSLESWPQVYTFSPSSITFRLAINNGAEMPYADEDLVWTPAFQLVIVTALDMSAMTRDPIWRFNVSAGSEQPTEFDVSLGLTLECEDDAGDPCTGIVDYSENITGFYEPELRKILFFFFSCGKQKNFFFANQRCALL